MNIHATFDDDNLPAGDAFSKPDGPMTLCSMANNKLYQVNY